MVSRLAYRDQSRVFLDQANEELAKGDLRQASEKGWGVAAQMIKAVAESKGLRHSAHPLLSEAVSRFVEETGDLEIGIWYSQATVLHVNFYEGGLSEILVEQAIQDVARFVEKLEALL